MLRLRAATPDDLDAIATLHATVWRDTYRDLAPADAIAALGVGVRRARWAALLAAPDPRQRIVVAEEDGRIVGFGLAGPSTGAEFGGRAEVKFLYVDRTCSRRGVGRMLLADMARHVAATGHAGMALAVVDGNAPAIAFYDAMGGRAVGRATDPGPLWRSDNIIYAWDDLSDPRLLPRG